MKTKKQPLPPRKMKLADYLAQGKRLGDAMSMAGYSEHEELAALDDLKSEHRAEALRSFGYEALKQAWEYITHTDTDDTVDDINKAKTMAQIANIALTHALKDKLITKALPDGHKTLWDD